CLQKLCIGFFSVIIVLEQDVGKQQQHRERHNEQNDDDLRLFKAERLQFLFCFYAGKSAFVFVNLKVQSLGGTHFKPNLRLVFFAQSVVGRKGFKGLFVIAHIGQEKRFLR